MRWSLSQTSISDRAVFLVNPASANGTTGRRWPELARRMSELGLEGDALFSERPEHLRDIARHAAEQGARLVRRIEGYGPVADIIISHHERVDGKGYPHGVAGDEIPLGSRIISVADTYDVMTSRDSYRRPVSSEAAIVELRRVSGSQLDPEVVERFVEMVESGRVAFRHADEADFERELAFDRRVADYARPRAAAA